MVVELASGENAITINESDSLVVRIYDENNKEIPLDDVDVFVYDEYW
jgi:hypothetical protein